MQLDISKIYKYYKNNSRIFQHMSQSKMYSKIKMYIINIAYAHALIKYLVDPKQRRIRKKKTI